MKNLIKRFWPLLAAGLLAVGILTGVLLYNARRTPERAVEGWIRASLEYDADGVIKYASEYLLTELKGNDRGMDTEALRRSLREGFEQAKEYRKTGKITFQSEAGAPILPGSDEFAELLKKYEYKADPSKVEAFALVTSHCYVDGTLYGSYLVYAVQCEGTWYYGFNKGT